MPSSNPDIRQELKALILPLIDDLHCVALRLTRSGTEAEELVAETVMRACEGYSSLRDHAKAKQWMLRILSNTFISNYRTKKSHQEISLNERYDDGEPLFSLFDEMQEISESDRNPERELINKLLDEDIQKAVSSLPEVFRVVVVLCDVEGYSYEEIAKIVEVPVGTVRSRLARGRAHLQKMLYHHALENGLIADATQSKKNLRTHEECNCK